MDISYLGHASFKLSNKTGVVVLSDGKVDLTAGNHMLITGPGEYEIGGISVIGFRRKDDGLAFVVEMEGLRICYLGDWEKVSDKEVDQIGDIDVLMALTKASDAALAIEPKIIVPIYLGKADADEFVKAVGVKAEKMDKLSLKLGSLPTGEQLVALLGEGKNGKS